MVIIDASVAVKWFFVEQGTTESTTLFGSEVSFCAPEIIYGEVLSAICREYRMNKLLHEDCLLYAEIWREIYQSRFQKIFPTLEIAPLALEIALKTKHKFPDCLYLAAAQKVDAKIATFDQKQLDAATFLKIPFHSLHV